MRRRAIQRDAPHCGADHEFYERALSCEELAIYSRARRVRGLDDEIAILRLRLFALLQPGQDGDETARTPAIARLVDLLIKALRAQAAAGSDDYRLGNLLDEESARILAEAGKK